MIAALWRREWLATSRLARTPWLLALLSIGSGSLLLLFGVSSSDPPSDTGRSLFQVTFYLATLFVTLFGPAIAANGFALEREGRTWEALLMAGLGPRAIDRGKFLGAYTQLSVYLLALLPCFAIPHVFGGVRLVETALAIVMVLVIGALTVRFGLLVSAIVPSARATLVVTLVASAVLSFLVAGASTVFSEALRQDDLSRHATDGPAFWPFAIVYHRFGVDYLRYLVITPVGGAIIAWSTLRGLTLDALSGKPRSSGFGHVVLLVATAVILGLLPQGWSGVLAADLFFALAAAFAVLTIAGAPARGKTLGRSLGLVAAVAAGFFVVVGVAYGLERAAGSGYRWYDLTTSERREEIVNVLFYGPSFALFVVGVTSLLRTFFRRAMLVRAIAALVMAVVAIGPLLVGAFAKATEHRPELAFAASPFGVVAAGRTELVCAAIVWSLAGVVLLAITRRRESR